MTLQVYGFRKATLLAQTLQMNFLDDSAQWIYVKKLLNQFDTVPTNLLNWKSTIEYQALVKSWTTPLRRRIQVERAPLAWATEVCRQHHYLKTGVSGYAHPLAFSINLDRAIIGVIVVSTPLARKIKGVYGFPGLLSSWEVLVLNRFWILPQMQNHQVLDSQGSPHTLAIASCAMSKLLKRVETDWLRHHPPVDLTQPYRIRKIISYSDSAFHDGGIYRASGFQWHAGNCGTLKRLDRWIYTLPETLDPLLSLQAQQLEITPGSTSSRQKARRDRWQQQTVPDPRSSPFLQIPIQL